MKDEEKLKPNELENFFLWNVIRNKIIDNLNVDSFQKLNPLVNEICFEAEKYFSAIRHAEKPVPLDKVKIYHLIKKYFLMIPGDDRPTNILQDTALDDACDEICARFGSVPVVPDVNWPEEKNSCSDTWHNVSTTDLYHARSCPKCHSIENNLGMQRNEGWNRAVKACKAAFDKAVKEKIG